VLHQRPFRDSSRIVEIFARHHGRLTVFSRGTRRSGSSVTAVLQPFNRLLVSWAGRGEAGTLTHAEFDGAPVRLAPGLLMSAFYLNELVLRLLARHDAHSDVFDLYEAALGALRIEGEESRTLRLFEKRLLEAIGYGLTLDRDARSGAAVRVDRNYRFLPDEGFVEAGPQVADGGWFVSGTALVSLAEERLDVAAIRAECRRILRVALDRCLEGRALRSREVMHEMRERNIAERGPEAGE